MIQYKTLISTALLLGLSFSAYAADNTPGVTDKEIKIGSTAPYSGPAAAYSLAHKTLSAYFARLNANGGINGHTINFISLDDAYNPAKTVEQTKKLVESDGVTFIGVGVGSANNLSVRKYLNDKGIPQMFIGSGLPEFNMPKEYPWTTPGLPDYALEATIEANYLLKNKPDAKIAILYQNDDFGKSYLNAFKKTLGDKAKEMIVAEESYEVTNPTIKAQMLNLKNSKATVLYDISTPKQAIQALQELKGSDWKPLHIMTLPTAIKEVVFKAVGYENAKGILSAAVSKDLSDPKWEKDPDVIEYKKFVTETLGKDADPNTFLIQTGYYYGHLLENIIRKAGDDLSRKNILKVATNYSDDKPPLLLPGITIKITPDDYRLYHKMQIVEFDGKSWQPVGEPQGE